MHPSVKFAADFALGMVSEKMRHRIKFFTTLDSAKSIDKSLLPAEYGGTLPMAEMIGKYDFWGRFAEFAFMWIVICRLVEGRISRPSIDPTEQR